MPEIWIRATSSPSSTPTPSTSGSSVQQSITTTSSSLSSSSHFDLFPSSSTPSPSPTTNRPETPPGKQSVPQLVLEWVFALAAVGVLVILLFCRYTSLRRRGRPVRELFSRGTNDRPPSPGARPFHHSIRHPYNHPVPLPSSDQRSGIILPSQNIHSAVHSDALFTIPTLPQPGQHPSSRSRNRAVTGAGTDVGGRRLDSGEPGEGKEYLPAYDNGRDGPPKYAELMAARIDAMEMVDLGSPSSENEPERHHQGDEHEEAEEDVGSLHPLNEATAENATTPGPDRPPYHHPES